MKGTLKLPETGQFRLLYAVIHGVSVQLLVNPKGVVMSVLAKHKHPLAPFYDIEMQQN